MKLYEVELAPVDVKGAYGFVKWVKLWIASSSVEAAIREIRRMGTFQDPDLWKVASAVRSPHDDIVERKA